MKKTIFSFLLLFFAVAIGRADNASDPLAGAKDLFMQKKYWQTIQACNDVIRRYPDSPALLSEANYFAAASYVNLFDFFTAKKNFLIIIEKYKGTPYYEDAYMGLGDIELMQENLEAALKVYNQFLSTNPSSKRLATLYFRLAEVNLKLGNKDDFEKYMKLLEEKFPETFEAKDAQRLRDYAKFFTVQVGAFTNYDNAQKVIDQLKAKNYPVYSVLCMLSGKKMCRIRVGRCATEAEAQELKGRLEKDGFFAKIFPQDEYKKD